jgi:hypothetical protein
MNIMPPFHIPDKKDNIQTIVKQYPTIEYNPTTIFPWDEKPTPFQ